MRQRPQDLRNPRAVVARPQEIAALLRHRRGQRIKEAPCDQSPAKGGSTATLGRRVVGGEGKGHRHVGPGMLIEILDQGFGEVLTAAGQRQRQVQNNILARVRVDAQPMLALKRQKI